MPKQTIYNMYLPFEQMPAHSRIWVYQGSSLMDEAETARLRQQAINFVENWTAHQAGLKASVEIFHNLFVVFAVDETFNDASGCSLDKKVHFMKETGAAMGQNFFDRMRLSVLMNSKPVLIHLNELEQNFAAGVLNGSSLFFNNLVTNMDEFRSSWMVPIVDSWPGNFITSLTSGTKNS